MVEAWSERRPYRSESERHELANRASAHLPQRPSDLGPTFVSEADEEAMKAAFIARFNEDLPRTETLYWVANIGYRMCLRDLAAKK